MVELPDAGVKLLSFEVGSGSGAGVATLFRRVEIRASFN
jgi:hypothetical protein